MEGLGKEFLLSEVSEWDSLCRLKAKGCAFSCVAPLSCTLNITVLVWIIGRFQSVFLQITSANVLFLIKWKLSSHRKIPWIACEVNNLVNPSYFRHCSQTTKFCRLVLLQFGLKIKGLARITGKDILNEERKNTSRVTSMFFLWLRSSTFITQETTYTLWINESHSYSVTVSINWEKVRKSLVAKFADNLKLLDK